MTWIRIEDSFTSNPKIALLSDGAFRLYITGLCYSGKHLTDGFLPAPLRRTLGAEMASKLVKKLLEKGLWDKVEGGYQIHDYLKYQTSKEQAEQEKALNRARAAKARRLKTEAQSNAVTAPVLPKPVTPVVTITPTPTPTPTIKDSLSAMKSLTREVVDICNLLADHVESNLREKSKNPEKVKRPEISKAWVTQMDLLIRKDGHSVEEVREIIEWSQADEFWSSNVMSPAKLRKQFDQLMLKKPKGPTQPKALPHAKTTDPNTGEDYCQNCGSAWPCLTESKKGGNQF